MTYRTMGTGGHEGASASDWVRRWSHLISPGASVLDVACGSGRHVRWFEGRGCRVTGVDRDAAATASLTAIAEIIVADIESASWPVRGRSFDAVIVTNYLWRERLVDVMASVAPRGVLIYETFAAGNETIGKPSNPKFLLEPGELLRATAGLRVVAFEDGFESGFESRGAERSPRFVQRIVAVREDPGETMPRRHALSAPGSGRARSEGS